MTNVENPKKTPPITPEPSAATSVSTKRDVCTGGSALTLEILDRALVLLRRLARLEGPEVAALARLRVLLLGVQAILARLELSDHGALY
jgi:hypothetical protein